MTYASAIRRPFVFLIFRQGIAFPAQLMNIFACNSAAPLILETPRAVTLLPLKRQTIISESMKRHGFVSFSARFVGAILKSKGRRLPGIFRAFRPAMRVFLRSALPLPSGRTFPFLLSSACMAAATRLYHGRRTACTTVAVRVYHGRRTSGFTPQCARQCPILDASILLQDLTTAPISPCRNRYSVTTISSMRKRQPP